MSEEEIIRNIDSTHSVEHALWEYMLTRWIRGDNTMENARKFEYEGALDAKELYPGLKLIL